MQDRPSAQELLEAVRGFLESDVLDELTGRRRYHTRVAINVLRILEREWEGEEDALRAEFDRLTELLGPRDRPETFAGLRDGVRELNRQLAERIRAGELDARWADVHTVLRETVADKLRIANPGWLGTDDRDA